MLTVVEYLHSTHPKNLSPRHKRVSLTLKIVNIIIVKAAESELESESESVGVDSFGRSLSLSLSRRCGLGMFINLVSSSRS